MQVQNAVEFLKMICALDEKENLTDLGMLYIYSCGWIKFFIIGLAILFVIMDLKFVGSSFFFLEGRYLSMLPVDPKLGKMLIMGAVFHCFDPVLTVVSGLSVRDPFLLPQDKKDVSLLNNSKIFV